uniref:Cytochrome c oxidase subunit 3 n=1 Tax=Trichodectes canis TaxID=209909 RepID=A0A386B2A7_9NEOP|nr:cytochrome c oxidase subunit III [Trichodectes canis]
MNKSWVWSHPYHIVSISPWPLILSLTVFSFAFMGLMAFNSFCNVFLLFVPFSGLLLILMLWWRDIIRESTFQGCHCLEVQNGLRIGMISFILSEVMFFFSFFFGYFYLSLSPDIWIGAMWPPIGINPVDWMSVPVLNTLLLLSSGVSITWSHHAIIEKNHNQACLGLALTVLLGIVFVFFQYEEYFESSFSMSDSSFGSIFFLSTGFHGFHVIVGSMFLGVNLIRLLSKQFSNQHHFGFEGAAWYWHFVDVVWLVLFLCFYWWGS